MSRKGSKSSGKLAMRLAMPIAAFGFVGSLIVGIAVVQTLPTGVRAHADVVTDGWFWAFVVAVVVGGLGAVFGWMLGSQVGARVTDLGLAVSKLGRGGTEVKVRTGGNDEIGQLGRSIQYLASDLTQLLQEQEKGGGGLASMDPLVKQLRDKTLPHGFPAFAGYEIDGNLAPGSRGGLDYFDIALVDDTAVLWLVSAEGQSALSVFACRAARDELQRALAGGAAPRKALAQTNKALKGLLPAGVCAKATLLQVSVAGGKLYQAGARSPLLICQRGEVLELAAEGIALGLDEGPVFEKALRAQEIAMSPGTRLVLCNEAALRTQGFLALLKQHSPKHTAMFMNVVLGGLEQDAGSEGLREDVVLVTAKKAGQA